MYFAMLPLMLQVLVLFGASLLDGSAGERDPRLQAILETNPPIELRLEHPETPEPGSVWFKWPEGDLFWAPPTPEDAAGNPAPDRIELVPTDTSMVTQEFRLTTYINFVLLLMLGIVIAFQMPLVIVLLGWLGLVTPAELRSKRKYALFICAAVAAVITPADALSMIVMLIPLYALYELSILLLIVAPASAVAEGTLRKRWRSGS